MQPRLAGDTHATMDNTRSLAARVALLQSIAGVSSTELAKLVGVSRGTISGFTAGRWRDLHTATTVSLARVTGASLPWLAAGVGRPPSPASVRRAIAAARVSVAESRAPTSEAA